MKSFILPAIMLLACKAVPQSNQMNQLMTMRQAGYVAGSFDAYNTASN